ncbi:hypothetical protein [Streptomyces sp. NPDC090025]|uniref:hypothetical protein n=1 Tax=Streptomyces sp. NPDC090025 TaxID=3365922 RepID=UPI00383654F3
MTAGNGRTGRIPGRGAGLAALLGATAVVALGALPAAAAGPGGMGPLPSAPSPERAAAAPQTIDTVARFFARDGKGAESAALARSAGVPRIEGGSVPVRLLSPAFVAGKPGAPVAEVEFHASKAVAADGRTASLWTVRGADGGWQVVNIATGDDEIRFAAQGARLRPGGTVFREPQIDAWYVQKGGEVLPLDEDAVRAVGRDGVTLAAYRTRVAKAYGDKLPGSAYARKGVAGGYDSGARDGGKAGGAAPAPGAPASGASDVPPSAAAHADPEVTVASAAAGAGAVLALGLMGTAALRRRRRGTAEPTA